MIQLVKTRIDCEHSKEVLLAYSAPIFRADWVYWYACSECGRVRRFTHRQAQSNRARREVIRTAEENSSMEVIYGLRKDD